MYRTVDTRGLSDAELRDARHAIVAAVTDEVLRRGIDTAVFCDVPGGLPGPGVLLDGRHDAVSLRTVRADRVARLPAVPAVPAGEEAMLVWAHVDGNEWRTCWPECQRVHVLWRDEPLTIPGTELARRIADRRAYRIALRDYATALTGLLSALASTMWSSYTPAASPVAAPSADALGEALAGNVDVFAALR
ncbi:MAG TPA: hypothetical protein VIB48_15265 [Acidimicrobiia bacterium]|jgi:hypothetical protein